MLVQHQALILQAIMALAVVPVQQLQAPAAARGQVLLAGRTALAGEGSCAVGWGGRKTVGGMARVGWRATLVEFLLQDLGMADQTLQGKLSMSGMADFCSE